MISKGEIKTGSFFPRRWWEYFLQVIGTWESKKISWWRNKKGEGKGPYYLKHEYKLSKAIEGGKDLAV